MNISTSNNSETYLVNNNNNNNNNDNDNNDNSNINLSDGINYCQLNSNLNSKSNSKSNICNRPFFNKIFFNIKNEPYEIIIMWSVLIITILLLLLLLFDSVVNEQERLRVLN